MGQPLNVIDLPVKELRTVRYEPPACVQNISLGHLYEQIIPKAAQLDFLLMSQRHAITEWHVDFSNTSVFYFIAKGEKEFVIAPGTADSWEALKAWEMKPNKYVLNYCAIL